ncbi:hypothetical protein, partial [Neisseria polysaccharea]|uniref:hypothetical protein n=1 Tax=Neisseria polysaccharea TaxID=489 RepID=UPI0040378CBA
GLLKEGAHEKSPKCLGGNLGDFGEFCKGLWKGNGWKKTCAISGNESTQRKCRLNMRSGGVFITKTLHGGWFYTCLSFCVAHT